MRRFVAKASGATLGFIGGNIPGAYLGWKAGGRLYDYTNKMPPIPRGRRLSRTPSRKRSRSVSRSRSRPTYKRARFTSPKRYGAAARYGGRAARRARRRAAYVAQTPSSSFFFKLRRGVRPPKGFKKVGAPCHVTSVSQIKITSGAQRQGANTLPLFFSNFGGLPNQSFAVPGAVDTERMIGSLQQNTSGSAGNNTLRYFIPYIKLKTKMRNMTTGPLDVWIYDLIARRDQDYIFNQNYLMANSPMIAWSDGLGDEATTGLGTIPVNYQNAGVTPFQSEKFCQYWHVRKVTKRTLGAGSEHYHSAHLSLNRLHNRAFSAELAAYARESYSCLVVIKAGIYENNLNDAVIVYGVGQLDCVTEYHAMVQTLEKNRTTVANYQNLFVYEGTLEQVTEDTDEVAQEATVSAP